MWVNVRTQLKTPPDEAGLAGFSTMEGKEPHFSQNPHRHSPGRQRRDAETAMHFSIERNNQLATAKACLSGVAGTKTASTEPPPGEPPPSHLAFHFPLPFSEATVPFWQTAAGSSIRATRQSPVYRQRRCPLTRKETRTLRQLIGVKKERERSSRGLCASLRPPRFPVSLLVRFFVNNV